MKKLLTVLIGVVICLTQPCLGLESMGKVKLNATPDKGCIFAGWYDESGKPIKGEVDYRTASYTCVAMEGVAKMTARFATVEDDMASLVVNVEDKATAADGMFALDLGACVESLSLPKLSVSGLPSGIKYDSKTLMISGAATKPGVYTVKVSATNTSVKKALVKEFRITVPNLSCAALPNLMPETDAYGKVMAGVAFDADHVNCSPKDGWTVKVTGLPAGLKYDAKTGKITGIPTAKAGSYTVTFTASKKGEKDQVATITLNVESLPEWAVGTFYGKRVARGGSGDWTCPMLFTVTVSSAGKVSMKSAAPGEGTESLTTQLSKVYDDGSLGWSFHYTAGKKGKDGYTDGDCEGRIDCVELHDGTKVGRLTMNDSGVCDEDDDPYESESEAYQDLFARKPVVAGLPTFGKDNTRAISVASDITDGAVTLKFGSKGAVTATWPVTKNSATCSSHIMPYAIDEDGTVHAKLWTIFLDKTHLDYDDDPVQVGFEFDLAIPSASTAVASDIGVKSVRIVSWLADLYHGGPLEIQVSALPDWAVGSFYGWEQWIEEGEDPRNLDMDIQKFTIHRSGWLSEFHGISESGNTWSQTYPKDYLPKKLDDGGYEWGVPSSENPPGEHACLRKSLMVSKFLYAGIEIGKATLDGAYQATRDEPKATQYAEFIQDPWSLSVRPQHLPSFDTKDNTLVLKVESYYGPLTARLTFGEKGNVSVSWSGPGISSATTDTRLMPYAYDGDADVCHVTLPIYGGKAVKYGFSAILDLTIPHPDSATTHDVSFSLKASSWQIYGFSAGGE